MFNDVLALMAFAFKREIMLEIMGDLQIMKLKCALKMQGKYHLTCKYMQLVVTLIYAALLYYKKNGSILPTEGYVRYVTFLFICRVKDRSACIQLKL